MVRPGGAEEVASAAALDRNVADDRDRLTNLAAAQVEGRLLVAERGGDIVGYAIHGKFFEYDFVEMLIVRPSDRRAGVATALVAAVEARSRSGKLFTSTSPTRCAPGNRGRDRSFRQRGAGRPWRSQRTTPRSSWSSLKTGPTRP